MGNVSSSPLELLERIVGKFLREHWKCGKYPKEICHSMEKNNGCMDGRCLSLSLPDFLDTFLRMHWDNGIFHGTMRRTGWDLMGSPHDFFNGNMRNMHFSECLNLECGKTLNDKKNELQHSKVGMGLLKNYVITSWVHHHIEYVYIYGAFHQWGIPTSWLVYNGKSHLKGW